MITGQGAFGKMADAGALGIGPALLGRMRRKKADGTPMTPQEEQAAGAMKRGGQVKTPSGGKVKRGYGKARCG
jgi:hypothetical protein